LRPECTGQTTAQPSPDETPRPEPRGLRLNPSGYSGSTSWYFCWDETPRPEPRGLRRGRQSRDLS